MRTIDCPGYVSGVCSDRFNRICPVRVRRRDNLHAGRANLLGLLCAGDRVLCTETYTSYYVPTTTYYAPESYATYYAPTTTYYAPAAYTSYYAPAAYTSYYAPTTAYYTPYAAYSPVVAAPYVTYYGSAGASVYGTPKVYVRGEPVRNALRALTP